MTGLTQLVVVGAVALWWLQSSSLALHPHTHLPTPGLIRARGYPAEVHHVVTQDGYILQMHRIPQGRLRKGNPLVFPRPFEPRTLNPRHRQGYQPFLHQQHLSRTPRQTRINNHLDNSTSSVNTSGRCSRETRVASRWCKAAKASATRRRSRPRPVVFLQHGVFCSSADFVMNDSDQALGFILADLGYDVWLGNARGNVYSRRHLTLSPKQPKFWDFSWDKMAQYDLPAMLSYVRSMTGRAQLDYVGHSMGTTIFFTMMNYHPHINSWIRRMAAMAPSAYIHNTFLGYRALSPIFNLFNMLQKLGGNYKKYEGGSLSRKMKSVLSKLCEPHVPSHYICQTIIAIIGGPSLPSSIDSDYLPVIVAHTPAGGSNNILAHYGQLVMARKYQAFDYGRRKNLFVYGTSKPPPFSLQAVTAPVGLFWAESDWVNSPPDVKQIASELPHVILNHRVQLQRFNHLDFLWAENANVYVYQPLINYLNASYSPW